MLRLVKVPHYDFLICIKYRIWGSRRAELNKWQSGDYIVFLVSNYIAGVAKVKGEMYNSDIFYWEKDLFPYLLPIEFTHVFLPNTIPFEDIKDLLKQKYGVKYGWVILNKQPIPKEICDVIFNKIQNNENKQTDIVNNLDTLLKNSQ